MMPQVAQLVSVAAVTAFPLEQHLAATGASLYTLRPRKRGVVVVVVEPHREQPTACQA